MPDALESARGVLFRYAGGNPNGSERDIAGVVDRGGRVAGLMPHPERAVEDAHGSTDGRRLFEGLLEAVA